MTGRRAINSIDQVPPYGFMARDFEVELAYRAAPGAWPRASDYEGWVSAEAQLLADTAWPVWHRGSGKWVGKARDAALALTRADMGLMVALGERHFRVNSRHRGGRNTHEFWFNLEDNLFGNWPERYAAAFSGSSMTLDDLAAAFGSGGTGLFCGSIHWILKDELQRPRPHQFAAWLATPRPAVQRSWSAWSPSAICGHAFQALMGCCCVHGRNFPLSPADELELLRFAVDMGDRRVYAAVHYPSDNAMSWRVALDALKVMKVPQATIAFASQAIRESEVYLAMAASPSHAACVRMVDDSLI